MRLSMADLKRLGLRVVAATPAAGKDRESRCRRRPERLPEEVLWRAVCAAYPAAQREYCGAVPGRRYRIDVVLAEERIAIECDGWQHHGKFRQAHAADRERQNLLAIEGWLVLRFTAGQILKDIEGVMRTIDVAWRQKRAVR